MSAKEFYRRRVRGVPVLNGTASRVYSTVLRGRRRLRGRGNRVEVAPGSWRRRLRIDVQGNDNTVVVSTGGRSSFATIRVRGDGNEVMIGPGTHLDRGDIHVEDDGNRVVIGPGATLLRSFHLAVTEGTTLTMGAGALVSSDVQVRTGDSHAIFADGERINEASDVTIGDPGWMGNGARVLKGSHIPEGSVVATSAVVTGDFRDPGSVLAGSPARVVRTGVAWVADRRATEGVSHE